HILAFISIFILFTFFSACMQNDSESVTHETGQKENEIEENSKQVDKVETDKDAILQNKENADNDPKNDSESIDLKQFDREPEEWGENVTGVKTTFQTDKREMALTFDACGGPYGSGYDEELISFLKEENIPATLFVNERWI